MSATPPDSFPALTAELVRVQRELSLAYTRSVDPLAEFELAESAGELRARRDALLDQFGRLSLNWMLSGGVVAFQGEPDATQFDGLPIPTIVTPPPELLAAVGPPPADLPDIGAVRDELEHLANVTSIDSLARWDNAPKPAQRALIGLLTSRGRRVQDEIPSARHPVNVDGQLDQIFSALTSFSRQHQPGFVFGLRRHHHPVAGTWMDDALRWWQELSSPTEVS